MMAYIYKYILTFGEKKSALPISFHLQMSAALKSASSGGLNFLFNEDAC